MATTKRPGKRARKKPSKRATTKRATTKRATTKRATTKPAPKPAAESPAVARTAADLEPSEVNQILSSVTDEVTSPGNVPDPAAGSSTLPGDDAPPDDNAPAPAGEAAGYMDPSHWTDDRVRFYLRQMLNPIFSQLGKPTLSDEEIDEGGQVLGECMRRVLGARIDSPWVGLALWGAVVFGSRYMFELLAVLSQTRAGQALAQWIGGLFGRRQLAIVPASDVTPGATGG